MKRLVMAAAILLLVHVQAAAPPPPALAANGSAALSAFLTAAVTRGDLPGMVALVVSRDRVLYHEAFGKLNVAGNIAMPRDAVFRIASMTKPVTSLAALMLMEEGKLGLDDEVSKYVPALAAPRVISASDLTAGTYETRPATRAITIRHLLTHTSGIGYAWSNPTLAIAQKKTGLPEPELPLVHDPGEKWTYGASTRVVGAVVEKISGQRIDAFLESRILGPLGMSDTSFAVPAQKNARAVTIHQRTAGKLTEEANPATLPVTIRGDGGLYSTARDYGVFLQMLLNRGQLDGKRLLSERTVRLMTENQMGTLVVERQPTADPARSNPYPLGAGEDKWGLGFQLAAPRSRAANARSAGSYNWAGIYNTHFWVDPEKEIGVVLLMQVLPFYDEKCIEVLRGFESLVYRHLS